MAHHAPTRRIGRGVEPEDGRQALNDLDVMGRLLMVLLPFLAKIVVPYAAQRGPYIFTPPSSVSSAWYSSSWSCLSFMFPSLAAERRASLHVQLLPQPPVNQPGTE